MDKTRLGADLRKITAPDGLPDEVFATQNPFPIQFRMRLLSS
jgi:hypothetical protein